MMSLSSAPISGNNEEAEEEQEPEITRVYWKDADGEKEIDEVPIDGVVTLYVQTKNITAGEELAITVPLLSGEEVEVKGVVDRDGIVEIKNFKL